MKFKVGDKVFIKPFEEIKKLPCHQIEKIDNEEEEIVGECEDTDELGNVITAHNSFVNSMLKFCGKETVVERVCNTGDYKLVNTNNWSFIACWLERAPHYVDSFKEE